ncbi:unnamed protein product [Arctogadus glacialis]
MQDSIIVHLLNSEKVYSNIGLLSNCAEVYINSVHTFIMYLFVCLHILRETIENYFLACALKKRRKTHFCNTPLLSSVCLSGSLNVPMSHNMVNRHCSISSHTLVLVSYVHVLLQDSLSLSLSLSPSLPLSLSPPPPPPRRQCLIIGPWVWYERQGLNLAKRRHHSLLCLMRFCPFSVKH